MSAESHDKRWSRSAPAVLVRGRILGVLDTIIRAYTRREIDGLDRLAELEAPVIFVANHCSHVDTPLLLRTLPVGWRRRTSVGAAADYFYANALLASTVSLAFGTVPIERRGIARTEGLKRLIDSGWSLVIFAEGTRSRDGRVGALRAGAAALAADRGVPLVPVHVQGTHAAMPTGRWWLKRRRGGRHALRVSFGAPIEVDGADDRFEAMEQVRAFMASCGAETTPDPRMETRAAAVTAAHAAEP